MDSRVIDDPSPYTGLGDEQREWIRREQVIVYPGRDPAKPVLRWAPDNTMGRHPGALAPGSGVSPNHADSENGRAGSWKQTQPWLELLQRVLGPEDGGGFEKVVEGMINSALGGTTFKSWDCEECGHTNRIEIDRPPDPRAGIKLIEFLVPKPEQRTAVDVNMQVLQGRLSELIEIQNAEQIQAHGLTPEQIAARQKAVEDATS